MNNRYPCFFVSEISEFLNISGSSYHFYSQKK